VKILRGIAASPGIRIGRAYVLHSESFRVFPRSIPEKDIEKDIERFKKAIEESKQDILAVRENFKAQTNAFDLTEIFDTHVHLLEDVALVDETIKRVREEKKNIEFIFSENVEAIEKKFASIPDEYLRQRLHDIQAVSGRVLRKLLRREKRTLSDLKEIVVVIAHDLTPAETAGMDRENVRAFATDAGGNTSHTAIMAKALEIPAVVGLKNITAHVRHDDVVIVDGLRGDVIIAPDEQTLNEYQKRRERYLESERELQQIKDLPAQTIDGHTLTLSANIDMPEEVASALGHGAQGIGLFRTEFLFLNRTVPPSEDEQAEAYIKVARLMAPYPVTIRTLDIGGDKLLGGNARYREANPFMGCRAIRFCLEHPEIFKRQLRAILRAGTHGNVRLLLPMISSLSELRQAKSLLEEAKNDLGDEGVLFGSDVPVGVMIETPSAVLIADMLARESDFFSIGTNDLIQYSLAVDRVNEHIAYLYQPAHPGILRMLRLVIEAAEKGNIGLSICGEVAGDMSLALVVIGLGLKELSMVATAIPEVKKLIRSVSMNDIRALATRVLELSTTAEIQEEIQQTLEQLIPNFKGSEFLAQAHG